jgi:putative membrane protein
MALCEGATVHDPRLMPGPWNNGGAHWGLWALAGLTLLIIAGILAWVVVTLMRHQEGHPTGYPAPPAPGQIPGSAANPLHILDERLARGDIDVEDYTHRRAILRGEDGPGPAP